MTDEPDEESLLDTFWTVARRLRRGTSESLAPFDLSPSHSRALGVLLRVGAMRLGDLSARLGIAARSATEVVDALEDRGLVRRAADPSDRRATLVEATDEGWELMRRVREMRRDEADQLFQRLSARDRTDLTRILRKLAD